MDTNLRKTAGANKTVRRSQRAGSLGTSASNAVPFNRDAKQSAGVDPMGKQPERHDPVHTERPREDDQKIDCLHPRFHRIRHSINKGRCQKRIDTSQDGAKETRGALLSVDCVA